MGIVDRFANWGASKQKTLLDQLTMANAGSGHPNAMYNGLPSNISINWYNTPEEIMEGYYTKLASANGVTLDEIKQSLLTIGEKGDLSMVATNYQNELEGIRRQGCWGYCDYITGQLHFLIMPHCDQRTAQTMIAEELARMTPDRHSIEALEELRVSQISEIAVAAVDIMNLGTAFYTKEKGE